MIELELATVHGCRVADGRNLAAECHASLAESLTFAFSVDTPA